MTALLALVACGGAVDWGHIGGDDPDSMVVVDRHDHNAHRASAAPLQAPPASEHCYLCHSLRLFHTALAASRDRVAVAVRSIPIRLAPRFAVHTAFAATLPSRAPPAFTL